MGEGLVVVTVQVSVQACTVRELAAAAPELSWTPVCTVNEQLDEPDELSATSLGKLDDPTFLCVRAALPREPGLYLWTAAPDGAWSGQSSDRAVIYLGRATGAGGLRARLGDELRWVRNGVGRTANYRQANFHGHPRAMIMHDARTLYAVTADREQAAELERELLAVASYGCALSPLANGSSWWSSSTHQRRARQRGYDRLVAAGLLIDPIP
ncbi:hypothetical protein [Actinomycetospora lemnae]|uniref:GIY-YIG nuclease family protein n=1 Tax=Actinomycetospora lemnae TaxID=3019891 RepID=A0ABT5STF4_9PSEU|nr:hypothetical protein [Actinomycetospora sp. DW7H6]MDD7966116.1 hypothetical protein [Actinomycetospora sp. DW7H6]